MKKILMLILALTLCLSLVACGGTKTPETSEVTSNDITDDTAPDTTPETDATDEPVMTIDEALSEVVGQIYDIEPVELKLMAPSVIDLSNSDNVLYYSGLSSADDIEAAVFSEAAIGSQAYSLCLVRVKDSADAETVKKAMIEGINPAKWVCVNADEVRAISCGKVVMLVMNSSELFEGKADALCDAFVTVFGSENCGERLSK